VLLKDHVNLMGMHPLIGPNDPIGLRFVDMVDAYDPKLRTVMIGACLVRVVEHEVDEWRR
jgi:purine-nucleoside phosphorylase